MSSSSDLAAQGSLGIATEVDEQISVVRLEGALELSTGALLRRSLDLALLGEAPSLLVDLSGLRSVAPGCVSILKRVGGEARILGVRFALVEPTPDVLDVLVRLGVHRRLGVLWDRSDAQDWLGGSGARDRRQLFGSALPISLGSPSEARLLVTTWCRSCHLPGLAPVARLVASEFVTSAFLRGSTPILVLEDIRPARALRVVRIEVWEDCPAAVAVADDDLRARIVIRLSRDSGCDRTPEGILSWAEIVPVQSPTWG